MKTEAQRRAAEKYRKKLRDQGIKKDKSYMVFCNIVNDADVIAVLDAQENKSGFLKNLIRQDMKKHD